MLLKLNYDFDIAALLIEIILLFFYYQRRTVPSMQTRIFSLIVYILTTCSVLEISSSYCDLYLVDKVPIWIRWLIECTYFSCVNSFSVLYAVYCFLLLDLKKKYSYKKYNFLQVFLIVPYACCLLIIWLAPVLNDVYPMGFSIVKGVGYVRNHNIWFLIPYIISSFYLIITFLILIIHRKEVSKTTKYLLSFYIIIVVVSVMLQLCFYGLFVQNFAIALVSLVFYLCIQRQEDVIDGITDCFNQFAFDQITTRLFKRKNKFACVSLILDDTFFIANTIGLTQVNKFLRLVADFLKQEFSYQNVFNINSECFFILLKNPSEEKVQKTLMKLQKRFDFSWTWNNVELKLFSRFCVIECPEYAKSSSDLFDFVNLIKDDERYKKNIIYAEEIDLKVKHRTVYIEHYLRNGILENRFEVYYQPIYSVKEQRIIGAEALIRLQDEDGSFISPEDFIPIAEKTGTILRIGEFVFEEVCKMLSLINPEEYGITKIDINLSVAQCMQEILANQILAIQSVYKIPTSIINLEITETSAAHTPEILLKNMRALADAGFELSLDDYGSGYSNMNYMLNLPFKMIKIDKYIVWAAFSDPKAKKALTATVKMIKDMDLIVLAEGVEKKEHVEALIEMGYDYLQGYYYSKPVPKNEFLQIMKNSQNKN